MVPVDPFAAATVNRSAVNSYFNHEAKFFGLNNASIFVVDPDPKIRLKRMARRRVGAGRHRDQPAESLFLSPFRRRPQRKGHHERWHLAVASDVGWPDTELMGHAPLNLATVEKTEPEKKEGDKPAPAKTGSHYTVLVISPVREAFRDVYATEVTMTLLLFVCFLVTSVSGWWLGHHFVRPLREITEVAHQLSLGNLHIKTTVTRRDELGRLAVQINSVVDKLAEVTSQIRGGPPASQRPAVSLIAAPSNSLKGDRASRHAPGDR